MFYSHQLLARKAPLGQIWMAATMHAKINRRKLDKLNIIKICEEILNPSIPMALRLSGILMGGVVIVYERKVKLLYEDVTRLMVEINEAWKVKTAPDQKVLPKRKTQAKKEAITKSENEEMTLGDIEQSLQFSNTAATTMGIQHGAYFNMRLDNVIVDEVYINNEDPTEHLHQADPESITLVEPYQATADPYNDHFERFDIEGDDETQVNVPSLDDTQIPTMPIHSPPHREDPKEDDIMEDQHPGDPINHQTNVVMEARQEPRGRGPTKRKRGQPREITMDYEHTMIPAPLYQDWLQDASDIVSRRGRKKKPTHILSSKKIANLMKMPPVVLNCNLFTSENKDIYYPAPLLDLWVKSNQPPHNSPSGVSAHHPPELSSSSPPGGHDGDFTGFHVEDFDPPEMLRNNNQNTEDFMDELRANLNLEHGLKVPEAALPVSSQKSGGDSVRSSPIPLSEHGLSSHSDLTIGRISNRFTKKRLSSSRNSSGGLQPVDENEAIKLADSPTRDQEPLVETGPTQTQANINHPSDKITNSIHAQMKAHFETPGVPQVESLDLLAAGMTRRSAAQLFYQTLVLASRDVLKVEQKVPYGEILISRGSKM